MGRGVTFGGAQIWRQWAGHRTGGWINPQSQPPLNRYYGPPQAVTATFIPEAGHVDEAWTVAAQGACRLDYWRWSRALFGAGTQLTPTAPPSCPGGICVPPTPLPTPTPPPPPPVPPASLATRLALHSRYDPASSWTGTAEGAASTTDAVNISQNLHVVWPMGEPLDWTPRVTLTPIPDQVINDPWYGHIHYSYTQEIVGWDYGGSVGQTTATTRCHGGTAVPAGEGSGCRYTYLTDADLNETTIRGQAHVLWWLCSAITLHRLLVAHEALRSIRRYGCIMLPRADRRFNLDRSSSGCYSTNPPNVRVRSVATNLESEEQG